MSNLPFKNRLIFRNQTALFQRPAFPDGKPILSMHPASAPFPVMRSEDWNSDSWNPLDYGQDFDFKRPFFEQFKELRDRVPQIDKIAIRNENCDYANNLSDNKNCYMVFSISNAEDCMYCENSWGSKDCLECTNALQCENVMTARNASNAITYKVVNFVETVAILIFWLSVDPAKTVLDV